MADWCTIESDPGVFTELIEKFGVKDVQVEEVWDMDEAASRLSPIYGYIFLFKWQKDTRENLTILDEVPGLFYAKQMIQNACATQAIISVLMNQPELEIGPVLSNFKEFTQGFPPSEVGTALGTLDEVRIAHNSFRRHDPFQIVMDKNDEGDDAFHFISYVPHNGILYELDGLAKGPILHGECDPEKWTEKANPVIKERIAQYQSSEVRFTLLAIVKKPKTKYTEERDDLVLAKEQLVEQGMEEEAGQMQPEIDRLEGLIADEDAKLANWTKQNVRRRHNYVPFICEMLKKTAYYGLLPDLLEDAVERKKQRVTAAEERNNKDSQAKAV